MRNRLAASAAALGLCLALGATGALADDYDTLRSECAKQLQLSPSGCDCIADKAKAELSDQERGFVVAQVTRQQDKAASLQQGMNGDSVMKAINFMTTAPQACAGQ